MPRSWKERFGNEKSHTCIGCPLQHHAFRLTLTPRFSSQCCARCPMSLGLSAIRCSRDVTSVTVLPGGMCVTTWCNKSTVSTSGAA